MINIILLAFIYAITVSLTVMVVLFWFLLNVVMNRNTDESDLEKMKSILERSSTYLYKVDTVTGVNDSNVEVDTHVLVAYDYSKDEEIEFYFDEDDNIL